MKERGMENQTGSSLPIETAEIETSSWNELWNSAKNALDETERAPMMAELKRRVDSAKLSMIDIPMMTQGIASICLASSYDETSENNFYKKMYDQALAWEGQSMMGIKDYANPENSGMIMSLVMNAADQLSAKGLKNLKSTKSTQDERNWQTPQWEEVGKRMVPGRKWNSPQEIQVEYYKRKKALDADFQELMGLDIDQLSKLLEAPSAAAWQRDAQRGMISPENARPDQLPSHFQAMFGYSKYKVFAYSGARVEHGLDPYVVPILDIKKRDQRTQWAFMNGNISKARNAAAGWHTIWQSLKEEDFETAVKTTEEITGRKLEGAEETQELFTSIVAVNSAAEAMKASRGSFTEAARLLTGAGDGPNTDNVDAWATEMIQGDPKKYREVIDHEWVSHYYNKVIKAFGVVNLTEVSETQNISKFDVDEAKFKDDTWGDATDNVKINILWHLTNENGKGFKSLVKEIAAKDKGVEGMPNNVALREAVIEAALNAFLIDKFSRVSYQLAKKDNKKYGKLSPDPGWTDPLTMMLEPGFLPDKVKGTYAKHPEVWEEFNSGLRPDDILEEDDLIQASMLGGLKSQIRWADAHMAIIADSRGGGMSAWDPRTGQAGVEKAFDKLHTVFGGEKKIYTLKNGKTINGNQLTALMMGRVLNAKARATAIDNPGHSLGELGDIFNGNLDPKMMVHGEALVFLLGPRLDGKGGFISKMAGGRTGVNVNSYKKAQKEMLEALKFLRNNEQGKLANLGLKTLNEAGLLWFIIKTLYANTIAEPLGLPGVGGKRK